MKFKRTIDPDIVRENGVLVGEKNSMMWAFSNTIRSDGKISKHLDGN